MPNVDNTECICNTTCFHGAGCNIECSGHGKCDANWTCYAEPFSPWTGTYLEIPGCPRNPDTDMECSDHGDCNSELMECTCYNGWMGVACHVADCPGSPDCNARGFCNATVDPPQCTSCQGPWMGPVCDDPCVHGQETPPNSGNCECEEGWTGVGCNSECSEHGKISNETGRCVCDYVTGWKGTVCNVPGCPGLYGLDCSGRGQHDSPRTVQLCCVW